ncbi:MAG: hypothetical protein ACYDBB_17320 [Armatimonadota bacterium]
MMRLLYCLIIAGVFTLSALALPRPVQTFTVKDYLRHQWTDEIIHFPIAYTGTAPGSLTLTDAEGKPVPTQITGLTRKKGKVTGTAWTVATLPPSGTATFALRSGKSAPTALRLQAAGNTYLLGNERITLRLPRFTAKLAQPVDLTALPAPLLAVAAAGTDTWLGAGAWVNTGQPLQVKAATTTVLEGGPVRVTVRYRLVFTDDRFYQADLSLGARQDAALFTDNTNIDAPKAAFRFSFQSGLRADRLYWRNNYFADPAKGLTPGPIDFTKEQVLCTMRPWSFWWTKDLTAWAGFYQDGAEPFVGVLTLRPSRWNPGGWDGAERTAIPITARPGGQLDISLALLAQTLQKVDTTKMNAGEKVAAEYSQAALAGNTTSVVPLHRELAITVGNVADHVTKNDTKAKLRHQLIKYSEFPLDEVKDYAFDFTPGKAGRTHPFLLFTQEDITRVRKQAKTVPAVQKELARVVEYLNRCNVDSLVVKIQQPEGWKAFFRENYVGNNLFEMVPTGYLASDEKKYGIMLAAGVKGMAGEVMDTFLEAPTRAGIGGYGPWFSANWLRLLLAYDTIADSEYLTADEKQYIQAVLVFGSHFLAHPDYWNTEKGLCSANPNMTSMIRLPLGLLAMFQDGHPRSASWLVSAEKELQHELKEWVAPGGAWIENPGYQAASLDGMLLLAQAVKNVTGRDYFIDPQLKATLDYYGFILTPPDLRFPPNKAAGVTAPMTLPSIGDGFAGFITTFNGWAAQSTAKTDPAFSARQQFYWNAQNNYLSGGGRAQGYTLALTNAELPAATPDTLSRPLPGFGSILRTSWTDPKASYIAHRGGYWPTLGHWHYDYNEIVYHAKGVPLCVDFGNCYVPVHRCEPFYHNTVSFDLDKSSRTGKWGLWESKDADALDVRSLPRTLDYSTGRSVAGGNQRNDRYVLLVKSADPMGATYVVMRDRTQDGQPNQEFYWNLWCLSKEPEIAGNIAHFPGQFGVDLDAHVLAPANPKFITDKWGYKEQIYVWGWFEEIQHGVHVRKQGSTEDFFTVLYPRAPGQGAAGVTSLGDGRGAEVKHMEGTDIFLLSPGKPATLTSGNVQLAGEVAFARQYLDGKLRLAVIKGKATAGIGAWVLASDGPTAIEVAGTALTGESSGTAHTAQISMPPAVRAVTVTLDGKPVTAKYENGVLMLDLPAGDHVFTIAGK